MDDYYIHMFLGVSCTCVAEIKLASRECGTKAVDWLLPFIIGHSYLKRTRDTLKIAITKKPEEPEH